MKKLLITSALTIILSIIAPLSHATTHKKTHHKKTHAHKTVSRAMVQPIPIKEIQDYSGFSPDVKELIMNARKLTQMNLTYKFGSANPRERGMDCSGTIQYLLSKSKMYDVPRDAEGLFNWVKEDGNLHRVSTYDFNSSDFSKLKPGDLLFWSGTYATTHEISHVMMYLGKNEDGEPLMFGSSNGRSYQGKKMWGVSVFDFRLPSGRGKQKFVGYGCIPELTCA